MISDDLFKTPDTDANGIKAHSMVLAVAASDAAFDGRGELSGLSKADSNRYIQRAMNSVEIIIGMLHDEIRGGA